MEIEENIKFVLEKIRPFLLNDGGDVKFVKFDKETGTVYIKMLGSCSDCMFSDNTISDTVETILTSEIPEIISVKELKETLK